MDRRCGHRGRVRRRLERYLYVDLGNHTSSFTVGPTVISAIDSRVTDNIVRAGLNN